jgi:hypothetical protein
MDKTTYEHWKQLALEPNRSFTNEEPDIILLPSFTVPYVRLPMTTFFQQVTVSSLTQKSHDKPIGDFGNHATGIGPCTHAYSAFSVLSKLRRSR